MQPRQTAILAVMALLLGGYIYVVEIQGGAEREAAEVQERLLFSDLDATPLVRLEVGTQSGQTAVLEQGDLGWRMLEPVDFPASEETVAALVDAIVALERDDVVSSAAGPATFGFGADSTRIAFGGADDRLAFEIGGETPVGSNRYVRVEGADAGADIDVVASHRLGALHVELDELRDQRVLPFETAAVEQLRLTWSGVEVVLERRDGAWWMNAPVEGPADAATVDTLLADIAYLRADGFVDDAGDARASGLAAPVFVAELAGAQLGGEMLRFEAAASQSVAPPPPISPHEAIAPEPLAVRGREGFIYMVAGDRLSDWPRRVAAYRDKTLSRFDVSVARTFELELRSASEAAAGDAPLRIQGEFVGGEWVTTPESMAASAAAMLIAALSHLEGDDIVAESLGDREAAGLGLAPPRMSARVWGEGESGASAPLLAAVDLGLVRRGLGIMARVPGDGPVFVVDQAMQEQLPIDVEAFRSRFVAGPGEMDELDEEPTVAPGVDPVEGVVEPVI